MKHDEKSMSEEGEVEMDEELEEEEYERQKIAKFGQKHVRNEEELKKRLYEVQKSFYNRLESANLIKKQGKIPFSEHMTITTDPANVDPE